MEDHENYYETQLRRLKFDPIEAVGIKLVDHQANETNWFNLTKESIPYLRSWLDKVESSLKKRDRV